MAANDLAKIPEHRIGMTITRAMHDEAHEIISQTEDFLQPAKSETVRRWLAAFGPTVAGRMPEDEIRARLRSYEIALDFPPCCYTKRSLQMAARRFKFFPSVSELCELFDDIVRPHREAMAHAKRVLQERIKTTPPRFVKTDDDKNRVSELVRQAKEALARGTEELQGHAQR